MSYSCCDQADLVVQLLAEKGYDVEEGEDGYHFTYKDPEAKGDIECGDDFTTELAAWSSALEDYFERTEIEFYSVDDSEAECAGFSARERATILAALRTYQEVLGACAGDMPTTTIEDIATNSGTVEPLDQDEIDGLCERINT